MKRRIYHWRQLLLRAALLYGWEDRLMLDLAFRELFVALRLNLRAVVLDLFLERLRLRLPRLRRLARF